MGEGARRRGRAEWSDDEHETDRWCRVLAHHSVAADPTDLLLPPPGPSPATGAVVVHPGAAYGCRRWAAGRFATVARRLAADGHRIVVTGGAGEREIVQRVASDIGIDAGATDLRQLAAIVAGAALVICGDTGVAKLATASAHRRAALRAYPAGPVGPTDIRAAPGCCGDPTSHAATRAPTHPIPPCSRSHRRTSSPRPHRSSPAVR